MFTKFPYFSLISLLSIITIFSCKSAPPPIIIPSVNVSNPISMEVTGFDEYTGHLESPRVVNLSARVSGFITTANFQEGAMVKTGDVLFEIDDRPFKATVEKSQAAFSEAESSYKRFQSAKGAKAISDAEYDQAVAKAQQALATLKLAKLDLEWAKVTAPIDGRVGKKLITEGNLVTGGSGGGTLLANITSVDPIYVYINVPERAYLKYQELSKGWNESAVDLKDFKIPCSMELENEQDFPHHGTIDFVDNRVEPSTGTIQMRGVIPNANGSLTPGLFARVRIQGDKPHNALLVPDSAIGSDQNSKYLLVLGVDNRVLVKPVQLGTLVGSLREIKSGVGESDKVIVNGLQSARPNSVVSPVEVTLQSDGSFISSSSAQPEKK